jgi:hypothetical protein
VTTPVKSLLNISSEGDEDFAKVNENGVSIPIVQEGVRWDFRNETWNTHGFEYMPHPIPFIGTRGPTEISHRLPTFMQLFSLFWPWTILRTIVGETNCYVGEDDGKGGTRGGDKWEHFMVAGLKAFMAIHVYIGLKKQPNLKTYWMRNSIFQTLCNMRM